MHTTFCDGKNTAEEMVTAAIELGMTSMGFSAHSGMGFSTSWCMPPEVVILYREEIARLKKKYEGQIEILCGIEQDYYSIMPTKGYDYVIGSVHYLKVGDGEYHAVDGGKDELWAIIDRFYGSDPYAMAEDYFATVARLGEISPDIIGHFDLVAKFNRAGDMFDETHPRYLAAAFSAVDALLPLGVPFEINTGAISRGYRDIPYPAPAIMEYIAKKGGTFVFNSDSHKRETLCAGFDEWEERLRGLARIERFEPKYIH